MIWDRFILNYMGCDTFVIFFFLLFGVSNRLYLVLHTPKAFFSCLKMILS